MFVSSLAQHLDPPVAAAGDPANTSGLTILPKLDTTVRGRSAALSVAPEALATMLLT